MLNSVRQGCVTEEIIATLEDRVIDVPVPEKIRALEESNMLPVCVFPKVQSKCPGVLISGDTLVGCLDSVEWE